MTNRQKNAGFSLVEVLVVTVITGIVATAIFSLFRSTQDHAYSQDQVIDLQQNLRIAMDSLTNDIQMAGFLIPASMTPVTSAPSFLCRDLNTDGDCNDPGESAQLSFQSASPSLHVARLVTEVHIPENITGGVSPDLEVKFKVAASEMVDNLKSGLSGDSIRIISNPSQRQKIERKFTVHSKSRAAKTLTLKGFSSADSTTYHPGDMLVKHSGVIFPGTVSYHLKSDGQLRRETGSSSQTVAEHITDVEFKYFLADGTETAAVTGTAPDPFRKISAIRVLLTGTANISSHSGGTLRQLSKLIALKNR